MSIEGKAVSIEQGCDLLEVGSVEKEMSVGGITAKWVTDSQGATSVLVQDSVSGDFIQFSASN
jgi:hypothetical protein